MGRTASITYAGAKAGYWRLVRPALELGPLAQEAGTAARRGDLAISRA